MSAYSDWSAVVHRLGGTVTTMPRGRDGKPDARAAARYPVEIWGPRVNARVWPLPDAYVNAQPGQTITYGNGKTTTSLGYYLAPASAEQAAKRLAELTIAERLRITARDAGQALRETGAAVLALPRQAVGQVLGVPPWVVPLAIGVGAVVLFRALLPVLQDAASSRLGGR